MSRAPTENEIQQVQEVLRRIAGDLGMITDRSIAVRSVALERVTQRPAGPGCIHLSFKIGLQDGEAIRHGTLLLPLPAALTLAGYLLMMPEEAVASRRESIELDPSLKEALLELGNFVGGATEAALRILGRPEIKARSEGCQGVKPGLRPALACADGEAFDVARTKLTINGWPEFDALLILPVLSEPAVASSPS